MLIHSNGKLELWESPDKTFGVTKDGNIYLELFNSYITFLWKNGAELPDFIPQRMFAKYTGTYDKEMLIEYFSGHEKAI